MKVRNVLVVDDSKIIHAIYESMFRRFKFRDTEIHHAYNGQEALEILQNSPFLDLVLLDINMPVMNGLEFLQQINKTNNYRQIPVIIISEDNKRDSLIEGFQLGVVGYLSKPLEISHLYSLMDKILDPGTAYPSSSRLAFLNSSLSEKTEKC